MSETLLNSISIFVTAIIAFLCVKVLIIEVKGNKDGGANKSLTPSQRESVDNFSNIINVILTKFILPIFLTLAIIKTPRVQGGAIVFLLAGFLLPLAVYFGYKLSSKKNKTTPPWEGFLFATFGGGNRGILLAFILAQPLLLFFGSLTTSNLISENITEYTILTNFIIFDIGNFLFLVTLMPFLISKELTKNNSTIPLVTVNDLITKYGSTIFNIIIMVVVILAKLIQIDLGINVWMTELFNSFSNLISTLFKFLAFLSIFIMIRIESINMSSSRQAGYFIKALIIRIISASIILGLGLLFLIGLSLLFLYEWTGGFLILLFILTIFVFLPPSSIFPSIFSQIANSAGSNVKDPNELGNLVVVSNFLFIGIVIFCSIVAWLLSFQL